MNDSVTSAIHEMTVQISVSDMPKIKAILNHYKKMQKKRAWVGRKKRRRR